MKTYLGIADIARHFGVSVSTVATWRQRYDDFPDPDVMAGVSPGWRAERIAEIERWRQSRPGPGTRTDLREE